MILVLTEFEIGSNCTVNGMWKIEQTKHKYLQIYTWFFRHFIRFLCFFIKCKVSWPMFHKSSDSDSIPP